MFGINDRIQRYSSCGIVGFLLLTGLAMALTPQPATANPTGQNVTVGNATFAAVGNTLTVTNTPGTIIHWNDFSIAAGETTIFDQQSALSAVLNRVVGANPSSILGALQSNGRVFLINPNGILFGQNAQVDVGGLVASTLDISDLDFTNGFLNFTAGANAGSVENQGTITAASGGEVYLVGKDVTNSGLITAPDGKIVLAAGSSVMLYDPANPWMSVTIESAPDDQAINLSDLVAPNGRIDMYGALVRQGGVVSADSAVVDSAGYIYFRSSGAVTLDPGSSTSSINNVNGIEIRAVGDITLGGNLDSGTAGVWLETSAGAIVDNHTGAPDIAAGSLTMRASTGIGSANPLETKVSQMEAVNYSSGNIEIINSQPLDLGWDGLENRGGDISLTNDGDLYFDSSISALGDLTLTVSNGDLIGGYNGEMQEWGFLEANLLTLDLTGSTLEGDFYGYQPIATDISRVDITSRGAGSVGVANYSRGSLFVDGVSAVDSFDPLSGTPRLDISTDGDLIIFGSINAPGREVGISASWGIYDENPTGPTIVADRLYLSAFEGIGNDLEPIKTQVELLSAYNESLGDIWISNSGDLLLDQLVNYGGNIRLDNLGGDVILNNWGYEAMEGFSIHASDGALISVQTEGIPSIFADSLILELGDGMQQAEWLWNDLTQTNELSLLGYAPLLTNVNGIEIVNYNSGSIGVQNNSYSGLSIGWLMNDAVAGARVPLVEVYDNGSDLYIYGPIVAPGSQVVLQTQFGGIYDYNPAGFDIEALGLTLGAYDGIGAGDPLDTSVGQLAAYNGGYGSIEINNTGELTVLMLNNSTYGESVESVYLDNIGAVTFADGPADVGYITVAATVIVNPTYPEFIAPYGDFVVTAHSPLIIGTTGISAGENIVLTASAGGVGDNLTINGNLTSQNGMISLTAGDAIIEAPGVTMSAPLGIFRFDHLNPQTPTDQSVLAYFEAINPVLVGLDTILNPDGDPNADYDQTTSEGETREQTVKTYCN